MVPAIQESRITHHMQHVTRHTSRVTRNMLHVTRHTSHVTRLASHVTRHTSHVTRIVNAQPLASIDGADHEEHEEEAATAAQGEDGSAVLALADSDVVGLAPASVIVADIAHPAVR